MKAARRGLPLKLRLVALATLLLAAFMLILSLLYNTFSRRQTILQYSRSMQRHAYAISQNLSSLLLPRDDPEGDHFAVSEATLGPYLALTERLTGCSVYLVDARHNVTGLFGGVAQTLENPLLPVYLEQTIALGFLGKTPFLQSPREGDAILTASMPIMNAHSRVLGVVVLESSLRRLGYTQVSTTAILVMSGACAFALSILLAGVISAIFTRPIARLEQVALSLAAGQYDARARMTRRDEIGSLARSMDILAGRLEEARAQDERARQRQQELFSNISHELRTPVTVIRGSLEALRDGVANGERQRAYHEQMIRESCWLERLIHDLLELSRLQNDEYRLEMSPVDLSDLLGDVAMSARALCERKGVTLVCDEPPTRFIVRGDEARLRQMLMAVVDNAVKFTPPGKRITLWAEADAPVIGVRDEGVGIPPDERERIFDRFHYRRDPSRESTGLGLAIVQEIARRHGVTIRVDSREGEGTSFRFTFPAENAPD